MNSLQTVFLFSFLFFYCSFRLFAKVIFFFSLFFFFFFFFKDGEVEYLPLCISLPPSLIFSAIHLLTFFYFNVYILFFLFRYIMECMYSPKPYTHSFINWRGWRICRLHLHWGVPTPIYQPLRSGRIWHKVNF